MKQIRGSEASPRILAPYTGSVTLTIQDPELPTVVILVSLTSVPPPTRLGLDRQIHSRGKGRIQVSPPSAMGPALSGCRTWPVQWVAALCHRQPRGGIPDESPI